MSKRCFYEVLEVERSASDGELKTAFRKAAMKWHPDRNPGDQAAEVKFREIAEAYEILKDPQRRAAYDQFGHRAFEQGVGAGQQGFGTDFSEFMTDIFDTFFGETRQRGGRQARNRGSDLRYNLEIALEEAFTGKTASIRIPTAIRCETCQGSGTKAGSRPRTCATCAGAGQVRTSQGFFSIQRTCPTCNGRGEVIENPCEACHGAGRQTRERTLSVNVPAGVEDGTRIRLAGEGEAGSQGGPSGDLYIFIAIKPHAIFQRDGADLFCRVPIAMTVAALGGELEVPTLDGTQTQVKVPEGTQTGKQFRLRSKGMPVLRTRNVGDLYIQVVVETPQNLTRRQRELLAEFERESSGDTHPESSGFLSRVKELFAGLSG
ncbi:molecular chaperone DnaJ [Chelatococcus reniformis]|uniref:Chaperone protein DnaJ n=1 Tax=Chelatococcus reniformis TaxID=1494448 RepID=A0A916XQP0_9HYPH|nr:molecular chaperone DnaJ [Chelatococcus reniformis]GGC92920.1 chaperone protein DnaJ [Chelatococcus reniformis]